MVTILKIVTLQWRLSHNIPSLEPTLYVIGWLFTHNHEGNSNFWQVVNVAVHRMLDCYDIMQDLMWREYCRRLVHWRKQSVEMCDLYSVASNAFVLFRSSTGSASLFLSLSSSPLHPKLSHSLRLLTWCVEISVDRPLWVQLRQTSASFWHFPSSIFSLNPFISCMLYSTCELFAVSE